MTWRYLQQEHQILRDSFRKFLDQEARPFFDQWENERMIPRSFWRKMGDQWWQRNMEVWGRISVFPW